MSLLRSLEQLLSLNKPKQVTKAPLQDINQQRHNFRFQALNNPQADAQHQTNFSVVQPSNAIPTPKIQTFTAPAPAMQAPAGFKYGSVGKNADGESINGWMNAQGQPARLPDSKYIKQIPSNGPQMQYIDPVKKQQLALRRMII